MSKSQLNTRKKIIRIKIDDIKFYVNYIEFGWGNVLVAEHIKLTGDPQKAKKIVRQTTVDSNIKSINKYFSNKKISSIFTIKDKSLFKLNGKNVHAVPKEFKEKLKFELKKYKRNPPSWEGEVDINKIFMAGDDESLRKLNLTIQKYFEDRNKLLKLTNIDMSLFSTFEIDVVDANNEIRAEKLRIINNSK